MIVAAGAISAATRRSEQHTASAVVASAGVCEASMPARYEGDASTRVMKQLLTTPEAIAFCLHTSGPTSMR